jgi:hypothetical protein
MRRREYRDYSFVGLRVIERALGLVGAGPKAFDYSIKDRVWLWDLRLN